MKKSTIILDEDNCESIDRVIKYFIECDFTRSEMINSIVRASLKYCPPESFKKVFDLEKRTH